MGDGAQVAKSRRPNNSFYERVGRDFGGGEQAGRAVPQPSNKPVQAEGIAMGVQRWAERGDSYHGIGKTTDVVPAGLYRCNVGEMIGPYLTRMRFETDALLQLPDSEGEAILSEFRQFWTLKDKFSERGFLHKRGFLLWGPPGSGKTSTLALMVKRLVQEMDGLVLVLDCPGTAAQCLQLARKIEPDRPMVAIMEDLDALIRNHGENEYLSLLDGEAQVDNIVFVATTNYPERLDPRFVDRPSRFDTVKMIGMPSAEARRYYLTTKEPSLTGDELETWVEASDGFSVAHLKEMIIAVRCFGQPLLGDDGVVERLAQMHERRPSSEDTKGMAGFLAKVKPRRLGNVGGARIGNGAQTP